MLACSPRDGHLVASTFWVTGNKAAMNVSVPALEMALVGRAGCEFPSPELKGWEWEEEDLLDDWSGLLNRLDPLMADRAPSGEISGPLGCLVARECSSIS